MRVSAENQSGVFGEKIVSGQVVFALEAAKKDENRFQIAHLLPS